MNEWTDGGMTEPDFYVFYDFKGKHTQSIKDKSILKHECFTGGQSESFLRLKKNTHIQKDLDPSNQRVPNMEAVLAHIPIKIIYLDLPVWVPNGSVSGCQFTIP